MRKAAFWIGLYGLCVLAALAVTPGAAEALGFALTPLVGAAAAAWLARRERPRARHLLATAVAAALMVGAMSGLTTRSGAVAHDRAFETSDLHAA